MRTGSRNGCVEMRPRGRRNGNYKHGRYTAEAKQRRLQLTQWIRDQLRQTRAIMKRLHDLTGASRKSSQCGGWLPRHRAWTTPLLHEFDQARLTIPGTRATL